MAEKLTALCNKCGWYGEADPGLSAIPHDGCNYSACYSPTEVELYEARKKLASLPALIEAAMPIMQALEVREQRWPEVSLLDEFDLTITLGEARALRSVLTRIQGGG